jgi:formimidoylglutamate deiminase
VAGLCPITEANLGDGFSAVDFLAAGGASAWASDSNVRIDAAEEAAACSNTPSASPSAPQRAGRCGQALDRRRLLAALAGGAQASASDAGICVAARSADLVALDAGHPALLGREGDA